MSQSLKQPKTINQSGGKDWSDFLGDWGKHLVKEYGLSTKAAMDLELEAAELYAHDTRDGWCCACEADIAFALDSIKEEPEFTQLIDRAVIEGRIDTASRIRNGLPQDFTKALTYIDDMIFDLEETTTKQKGI